MDRDQREKILRLLEKNAMTSSHDIAVMLGLDEEIVTAEIEALERSRVICGYHAHIDWDKTDDEKISALIEVKVTPQRGGGYDEIAEKIYQYPEVESLYLMSGGYDFTVILKKSTMRQIANFVSSRLAVIDEVQSTTTHIVLERYKDHGITLGEAKRDHRVMVTP